ncbi:MAG TPA: GDP-mannose 4,6-dehydratase [Candidatus Taylorbacteria bacterium]|nr:MAG: NAD-dependent epimerase/dehydratase [Parcubacteria group bacterium GW2011_GWC2_48_17]HBV00767.1 GDP-mannose 4,6-dehydratase [Candidatus Taylorbacteria bacterium]
MKILVIGSTGMIGTAFAAESRARGFEVFGLARESAAARRAAIRDENLIFCDILDPDAIAETITKVKPDIIAHFAAQAFNGISWKMETLTHETNYLGTLNVLRAYRARAPRAKLLLACSSAEYGIVPKDEQPIKELRLLRPLTPYGVSKVGVEALGYQYFINYKLPIFLPRLFIHVGTGHPPVTMIQNFARELALIKKDRQKPVIRVGRLDTARDFIDVRDGVCAMHLLLEKGKAGEPVNVCTGSAYSGKQVLNMLMKISGVRAKIMEDKELLRPSDEMLLLGDNTIIKKLGWKQEYSLEETLREVYADWLNRI